MLNQIKAILFLGILSLLLVAIGSIGGPGMAAVSFFIAIGLNLGAYFYSDKLVLRMHQASEADPRSAGQLYAITRELAQAANLPMPKLYIIPSSLPNAFATGRNPAHAAVAVTEGLLQTLNTAELRGVIAHELAHIKNRDILLATVAAILATSVSHLADFVQWSSMFGQRHDEEGNSMPNLIAIALIAPLAAFILQMGLSRSREYVADETGAKISGDPRSLASALIRISQSTPQGGSLASASVASLYICGPGSVGSRILGLFSSHPPTEERIRRLNSMSGIGSGVVVNY